MAGQGWRDWQAGEQLTDDNMQQFLQDQAVMRFPDSDTRGSALAGVVSEGMVSYLDDVDALEVFDGVAWGAVTPDVPAASPSVEGVVYGLTGDLFVPVSPGVEGPSFRNNVSLGIAAGGTAQAVTTGIGNVIVGSVTGQNITTGHSNIILGGLAATSLTTGIRNVIIGDGFGVTTGSDNTFVGNAAGFNAGTAGSQNTFIGYKAGDVANAFDINGSNLTLLGHQANPSSTSVSNEITLGNSSVTALRCQVTTITSLSDARDKSDVKPINYGLDFINELNPVEFTWNTRDGAKVGLKDMGFIAQELAEVEDQHDAETLQLTYRTNPDKLEASQGRLIPILVKAIQELSARVEELENGR